MSSGMLSRHSFLGLDGKRVFIAGAAGTIGGEAVHEFLSMLLRFSLLNICPWCSSYHINSLPYKGRKLRVMLRPCLVNTA